MGQYRSGVALMWHGALHGADERAGAARAQGAGARGRHIGGMLRLAPGSERCTACAAVRRAGRAQRGSVVGRHAVPHADRLQALGDLLGAGAQLGVALHAVVDQR